MVTKEERHLQGSPQTEECLGIPGSSRTLQPDTWKARKPRVHGERNREFSRYEWDTWKDGLHGGKGGRICREWREQLAGLSDDSAVNHPAEQIRLRRASRCVLPTRRRRSSHIRDEITVPLFRDQRFSRWKGSSGGPGTGLNGEKSVVSRPAVRTPR